MNSPALRAAELLNSLGWTGPEDMSMEDIAWAYGLIVNRREMDGSEGRIVMNSDSAIITVNAKIDYQPKVNFIIAHEIGHACLHREKLPLFTDTDKTLADWYANGIHEAEANAFATELLIPAEIFTRKVKKRKLELPLIENVAAYFGASKTAAFLRYKDLGDFPVMIVYIENGIIKWKSNSHDFPFKYLPLNNEVPALTVAGDLFYHGVEEKSPVKVDAIEWFPDDFNIRGNEKMKLWEQCFPFSSEGILSCIWTA
jgi:Zn-dependent peptidase ImmA (M78 family)